MARYEVPAPLRNLMTERDSLKVQIDKVQNDYERLQDEKAKAIADYEAKLNDLLERRTKLQGQYDQFHTAVEAVKKNYELPTEEQAPPEEI